MLAKAIESTRLSGLAKFLLDGASPSKKDAVKTASGEISCQD